MSIDHLAGNISSKKKWYNRRTKDITKSILNQIDIIKSRLSHLIDTLRETWLDLQRSALTYDRDKEDLPRQKSVCDIGNYILVNWGKSNSPYGKYLYSWGIHFIFDTNWNPLIFSSEIPTVVTNARVDNAAFSFWWRIGSIYSEWKKTYQVWPLIKYSNKRRINIGSDSSFTIGWASFYLNPKDWRVYQDNLEYIGFLGVRSGSVQEISLDWVECYINNVIKKLWESYINPWSLMSHIPSWQSWNVWWNWERAKEIGSNFYKTIIPLYSKHLKEVNKKDTEEILLQKEWLRFLATLIYVDIFWSWSDKETLKLIEKY